MKKPFIFTVLKIVGVGGIVCAVAGMVLTVKGFGDFETNNFMIGGFMTTFGLFVGISSLISGFRPEMTKMAIKTHKYIQNESKEDLTDIATSSAEITSEAVTLTARAVSEGFYGDKVFCKECGAKIDADSKFCRECGTKQ